jgi:YD repeat-containing protein
MQTTGSAGSFVFGYAYNSRGLTSMKYPSTRMVTYGYDAGGRVSEVDGNPLTGGGTSYASGIVYSPAGAVTSLVLGNNYAYESRSYTSRLRPLELKVGSAGGTSDKLDLQVYYCAGQGLNCAGDNGNVMAQAQTAHDGTALNTGYTYDGLNRLLSAVEAASATGQQGWTQTFGYDFYGNRTRTDAGFTSMLTPGAGASFPANRWDWQGNGCATCYDGAGNQLTQAGGRSFTYDAENRMLTATEPAGTSSTATTTYRYDGDGRRVTKTVGSVTTTYVYDAMG